MALRLVTAPSVEPIDTATAKAHCRVTHSAEDSLIALYISAARQHLDGQTGVLGRALNTQTWELVLDQFPDGPIDIPLPPLQSITSIKYFDTAGVEQTLAGTEYSVDIHSKPGWVAPVDAWPETWDGINTVVIRFVCGYGGTAADVPAQLRAAILLHVGDLYENRQIGGEKALPENPAYDRLIFPYRMLGV